MSDNSYHNPVMVREVVDFWYSDPSGIYIDAMAGGGGHTEALMQRLGKKGRVIAMDCDADAVAYLKDRFSEDARVEIKYGNFSEISSILTETGVKEVKGLFLDTGVSSHQLNMAAKGHTFQQDAPLDLRLDTRLETTAAGLVNSLSEEELADIIYNYGEERLSRRIARRIVEARSAEEIVSSLQLASIVGSAVAPKWRVKTLARVWQSLRYEVNQEVESFRDGLENVYSFLAPGAAVVTLTYESLMDRVVKRYFRGKTPSFKKDEQVSDTDYHFDVITRKVVLPSLEEIRLNSRSRSARLRCAKKKE